MFSKEIKFYISRSTYFENIPHHQFQENVKAFYNFLIVIPNYYLIVVK